MEETFTTMVSILRDPFTKYPGNYNVYTQNYMKLILCFWMQIGKGIRLEQHYGLLYMGLQNQRQVHQRLHHGKTIKIKNNTRTFNSMTSSSTITLRENYEQRKQYKKIQKYREIYQKS